MAFLSFLKRRAATASAALATAQPAHPTRRDWLRRLGAVVGAGVLAAPAAQAAPRGLGLRRGPNGTQGSEPFVGEIMLFTGNFAPTGWAICAGQLLPISQNTTLFSLLGTYYGGDGRSTFALPNLQGHTPMGVGQGPGLSERYPGEDTGAETITLLQSEMPAHTHGLPVSTSAGTSNTPTGRIPGVATGADAKGNALRLKTYAAPGQAQGSPTTVVGGNQPMNNRPPYLVLNYCIALQGVFPPRP